MADVWPFKQPSIHRQRIRQEYIGLLLYAVRTHDRAEQKVGEREIPLQQTKILGGSRAARSYSNTPRLWFCLVSLYVCVCVRCVLRLYHSCGSVCHARSSTSNTHSLTHTHTHAHSAPAPACSALTDRQTDAGRTTSPAAAASKAVMHRYASRSTTCINGQKRWLLRRPSRVTRGVGPPSSARRPLPHGPS